MALLKPFILVGCVAFTLGFVGYWAVSRLAAQAEGAGASVRSGVEATVAEPPPPELAAGKHI